MSTYVLFNGTGEIIQIISGSLTTVKANLPLNCDFLEYCGKHADKYVDVGNRQVAEKGDYTLESLPLPCTLTIEGVEYPCTEQPTFTFNYPGTYTIRVDAGVRYLVKEFDYDYQP